MLAAGCEQWKAPKKIKELEGRVDELTAAVEKLTGKPLGKKKSKKADKDDKKSEDGDDKEKSEATAGKDGEGKDEDAKDGESEGKDHDHEGKPETAAIAKEGEPEAKAEGNADGKPEGKDEGKDDGKPEGKTDGKDDGKPEGHEAAAKKEEASGKADKHDHDEPAKGEGSDAKLSKDDKALRDIAKLVASTTTNGKKTADRSEDGEKTKDDKVAKEETPGKEAKDAKDAKAGKDDAKPATEWGYTAKNGPPVWASLDPAWALCDDGKQQSPIDIEPRPGNASPIVFHYKATPASIVDNGHALQVDFGDGSWIEVSDHTYQLTQIVLRTPSEHTIAGEHFPLEAQLIHKDSQGKLANIAVLFDAGQESRALGALLARAPRKANAPAKVGAFDPAALLPDTRSVFRYNGSLTTPPCTEGVIWNVMRRQLTDSRAHIDALTARYRINARETRPLGKRKVE